MDGKTRDKCIKALNVLAAIGIAYWAVQGARIAYALHNQSIKTRILTAESRGAQRERARINRALRGMPPGDFGLCPADQPENGQ